MYKIILILGILITMAVSAGHSLKRNPIYHAIVILNKGIEKSKAFEYSNIISKLAKKYKLDPFLIVAIARQESHIHLGTIRTKEMDEIVKKGKKYFKIIEVTDFCMMQINTVNVRVLKLDPNRLLEDSQYCIENGVEILKGFKYLAKKDPYWWTRYNSSDRKPEKREEYKNFVLGHYAKLEKNIPDIKKIVEEYTKEPEIANNEYRTTFP